MWAVLLGLMVSASFSVADFLGGVASRKIDPWLVVFSNQVIGMVPLCLYLVLLTDHGPTGRDVALAMTAGAVSAIGLGLLFGGFAIGRMAVVAPVSAGIGGVVPILWGLAQGERPGPLALLGAMITLGAAVVLARSEAPVADAGVTVPGDDLKASIMAVGAGLAFGVILICFSETTRASGLWPPVIAHLVAITALATGLLLTHRGLVAPPEVRLPLLGSGFFDATAIALLVVALQEDLVSLVAPAANLYPAGTVVLAAVVLGERLHRVQVLALVAAAVGLALLASG